MLRELSRKECREEITGNVDLRPFTPPRTHCAQRLKLPSTDELSIVPAYVRVNYVQQKVRYFIFFMTHLLNEQKN